MVDTSLSSEQTARANQWLQQIPGPGQVVVEASGVAAGTVLIKGSEVTAACEVGDTILFSITAGDVVKLRDLSYYVIKEEQFIQIMTEEEEEEDDDEGGDDEIPET